jgi:signal transduction histidine kinase
MLDRTKSPTEIASILEKLGPQLNKAQTSVESMLADLLEVKAHPNLHREEIKLSVILDASLEHVFTLFRDKGVKIERNFEHSLPIFGDPTKLQRAFGNILQNAHEATNQHGRIWLTTRELTAKGITVTELTIGNEGSFVPEELRSKIFDMNYTSGKAGGTGLGLAIAKKVIEEHGGKITCHADKKIGTWFQILLPTAVIKEDLLTITSELNSAS